MNEKGQKPKSLTQNLRGMPYHLKLLFRAILAFVLFILGFNFSRSAFFEQYPLFGIKFLAEALLSTLAAAIGFYTIPRLVLKVAEVIENFIYNVVNDIVNSFWEQQSKRIQEARRIKQKKKSDEINEQIRDEFKHGILLDTSVLIDGRILDMVKTGFLENLLIVPQFVIDELHLISDSKEDLKRQKGRRGLDVLKNIKRNAKVITPEFAKNGNNGVDKELVNFAKFHKLRLMTLDFNLNKVASVAGIRVLNINDLSNAVKTVLLPGEEITVKIIQTGKERQQGVGYLPDGTMIVVESTRDLVGQDVRAKVSKVIQSSAGKIIFCEKLS